MNSTQKGTDSPADMNRAQCKTDDGGAMGSTKKAWSRPAAYILVAWAYVAGYGSLILLVVFLLFGPPDVVNLGLGEWQKLLLNCGLSLIFFLQHSAMIRPSFRRWSGRFMSELYHGAVYAIASGLVLIAVIVFWQKSAIVLGTAEGVYRLILRGVFLASIAGFYWGFRSLGKFDALGVGAILRRLRGKSTRQLPFKVQGPYRWVRHPLYLFALLMIWSSPDLTADRLLFNVLWTVWIVIGTLLEERDLVGAFGDSYRDYQKKVPMLIPTRITPGA